MVRKPVVTRRCVGFLIVMLAAAGPLKAAHLPDSTPVPVRCGARSRTPGSRSAIVPLLVRWAGEDIAGRRHGRAIWMTRLLECH